MSEHCTILGQTCTALECDGGRLCPNIAHWREQLDAAEAQIEALIPLVHQMDGLLTLAAHRGTAAVDDDWKHDAIQAAHAARALLAPTQSGSTQP